MAKAASPTQNLFALLGEEGEPGVDVRAPVKKEKKPAAAKAAEAPASSIPTPAEKAKAREAAKAKESSSPAAQRPPKTAERAPREDGSSARGGRPARGGRGARRAVNAESHHHEAPTHGRPNDRQSQGKFSRNAPPKKGGAGKGNWGDDVADSVVGQETAALVDGWGGNKVAVEEGKQEKKEGDKKDESTSEEKAPEAAPAPEPEPEDHTKTLDDYLKARQEAAAALAAKVGVIQPRKIENADMTGAVEKERPVEEVKTVVAGPTARKGEKAVNVNEFFNVRTPASDRPDRPRGRGRGGDRGGRGGRGGRGREDGAPRGAPRGDGAPRGAPRGDGAPRGGRGGRGREDGAPRGARDGAPRGGARGAPRGRALDVSNSRQFPTLGQ